MDKQNFELKDRFPLSTQSLTFMQDMIMATSRLALIGGNNYILSGCTVQGNAVTPGIIVINGEVMPFEGGAVGDTITIIETAEAVSANALTFENARVKRYAQFATGSGENYYPWANFKPLQTNKQLEEAKATISYVDEKIASLQSGSIPVGVIVMWGGREADIPKGWCLCDGRTLSDNMEVPDLRGRFIVGYNSTLRSGYSVIGEGSQEPDQYKVTLKKEHLPGHSHTFKDYYMLESSNISVPDTISYGKDSLSGKYGGAKGDTDNNTLFYKMHSTDETGNSVPFDIRPPYYVLAFIIKIKE